MSLHEAVGATVTNFIVWNFSEVFFSSGFGLLCHLGEASYLKKSQNIVQQTSKIQGLSPTGNPGRKYIVKGFTFIFFFFFLPVSKDCEVRKDGFYRIFVEIKK